MHTSAPQPSLSRVLSLIWFPFFFAAAFTLMGLFAFAHPEPHGLDIAVVGTPEQTATVQQVLDGQYPGGFVAQAADSPDAAFALVTDHTVVAAFAPGAEVSPLLIASAGGASEAKFVESVFGSVVAPALGLGATTVTDAVPPASGDVSGVGLFFYAFPQLLVGLITSIVLLQFGMWSLRKKVLLIASTGAFTSVFAFVIALALGVIPASGWLILISFVLTQAIGWLTTAAAIFGKRYFLPLAMTFVLVLGVPSSGGTVSGDMLPGFIRWLHSFMPFAQYLEAARSTAYFGGAGLVGPLLILLLWAALGGGLLILAAVLARRARAAAASDIQMDRVDAPGETPATAEFFGTVATTTGRPLAGATVILVNETGVDRRTATTGSSGEYRISAVPSGLHYAVVTAAHCEPEIATVALHPARAENSGHTEHPRNFTLLDWDDASGNLTAEEIDTRNALTAH